MLKEMKHINDNVLCAMSFRATGTIPFHNDMVELAILPLNNISLNRQIYPFHMRIKPIRTCVTNKRLSKAQFEEYKSAPHPNNVASLFEEWYKKLNLSWNKRIIPVGYDLFTLHGFLRDLFCFNDEGEDFITEWFDFSQARNLETITHYWNDLAWVNEEHYPFNKHQHTYCAWRLGHLYEKKASVLQKAIIYAEIYNRLCNTNFRGELPLKINYPSEIDYEKYQRDAEEQAAFAELED